jgi:hypothetical protein
VVDYDHVRTVAGVSELRRHAGAPSTTLLRVDNRLHTEELGGHRPWNDIIERLSHTAPFTRPDGHTDRLYVDGRVVQHPTDPQRPLDGPRVHRGVIGSADRLLRDAVMRDDLAARYRIRAVEMEGSGVAAAADLHERSWFMVRGAADYCDASKNDAWHPYAALVAAAYVRALLARCRPLPADGAVETRPPLQGLGAIVDALSVLPQMSEEPARRTLIRQLPDYVRTAVPENANPRLHVLNVIQTCTEFPGGEEFLLSALRITAGTSPEMSRIESIIRSNWPSR